MLVQVPVICRHRQGVYEGKCRELELMALLRSFRHGRCRSCYAALFFRAWSSDVESRSLSSINPLYLTTPAVSVARGVWKMRATLMPLIQR